MKQKYQGDIPILKIGKEYTKNIKFRPLKRDLVVALGEATGHRHIVKVKEPAKILWGEDENGKYLRILKGEAALEHNTHAPQILTKGTWFVGKQFEYDEVNEIRRVQD